MYGQKCRISSNLFFLLRVSILTRGSTHDYSQARNQEKEQLLHPVFRQLPPLEYMRQFVELTPKR